MRIILLVLVCGVPIAAAQAQYPQPVTGDQWFANCVQGTPLEPLPLIKRLMQEDPSFKPYIPTLSEAKQQCMETMPAVWLPTFTGPKNAQMRAAQAQLPYPQPINDAQRFANCIQTF